MRHWLTRILFALCLLSQQACSRGDESVTAGGTDEGPNEPPIVEMPNLSRVELLAAPGEIAVGDKTITFGWDKVPVVFRWTGLGDFDRSTRIHSWVTVAGCVSGQEEPCEDIDEVRLDFAWVVADTEVWAVELWDRGDGYVRWDSWVLVGWGNEGPEWPFGTEVWVVLGLTDRNGSVWLLGGSTTVIEVSLF